jgi:Tfp pilus assembly protein PilN
LEDSNFYPWREEERSMEKRFWRNFSLGVVAFGFLLLCLPLMAQEKFPSKTIEVSNMFGPVEERMYLSDISD